MQEAPLFVAATRVDADGKDNKGRQLASLFRSWAEPAGQGAAECWDGPGQREAKEDGKSLGEVVVTGVGAVEERRRQEDVVGEEGERREGQPERRLGWRRKEERVDGSRKREDKYTRRFRNQKSAGLGRAQTGCALRVLTR
jgi:hypothetical protein